MFYICLTPFHKKKWFVFDALIYGFSHSFRFAKKKKKKCVEIAFCENVSTKNKPASLTDAFSN
jgi:hypothetical protein